MMYKSILVINVSRIGDTLLTTPAIRALAVAFPEAKITVMGHPKRVEIIENLPYVHSVDGITKKTAPFKDRVWGRHWDLAVVFGFDEALVHYALRVADQVIAWEQADAELNRRVTKAIPKPPNDSCVAVDMLNVLPCEGLGIKAAGRALDYCITDVEARTAQQRIAAHWKIRPAPLIGLMLESFPTKPYRDWPLGHFLELCSRVLRDHPEAGFVILGGDHSKDKLEAFRQQFGERVAVMAGRLSLRESTAVMGELDLYIGCDTGPTHIAGALHKLPIIALYHCLHRSWVLKPQEHQALSALDHPATNENCSSACTMADISVDQVYQELKLRLDAFYPPAPVTGT